MDITLLIAIIAVVAIVIVAAAAFAVFAALDAKKRRELREGFGPEYHRAVARSGNSSATEKELLDRQKRVAQLNLQPIPSVDAARCAHAWHRAQERFVDDPTAAIRDADRLVRDVMRACGYPLTDFEQRAADVSVDHPSVVQNYRRAHEISEANDRGKVGTEDLRQAMVCYRSLFDDLLESEPAAQTVSR